MYWFIYGYIGCVGGRKARRWGACIKRGRRLQGGKGCTYCTMKTAGVLSVLLAAAAVVGGVVLGPRADPGGPCKMDSNWYV
jgi:hypothetical protein